MQEQQPVVKTSLNLPADLARWLKKHAEEQDRSVSAQTAHIIKRYRAEIERQP